MKKTLTLMVALAAACLMGAMSASAAADLNAASPIMKAYHTSAAQATPAAAPAVIQVAKRHKAPKAKHSEATPADTILASLDMSKGAGGAKKPPVKKPQPVKKGKVMASGPGDDDGGDPDIRRLRT